MRLTNVLNRCAAVVRAAARRVSGSLGQLGRAVVGAVTRLAAPAVSAVARVVQPVVSAVRTRLGHLARVVVPVTAVAVAPACSRPDSPAPAPTVAPIELAAAPAAPAAPPAPPVDAAVDAAPERPIGEFYMTFYYIAVEDEVSPRPVIAPTPSPTMLADVAPDAGAANDNVAPTLGGDDDEVELASVAAPALVPMMGRDCRPLVEVTPAFAASVRMQGTGRLRDGRLINVAGACRCGPICFHILPPGIPWGRGSWGLPLSPFRMVAVDPTVIPLGSLLYVPELDGRRMPGRAPHGGYIHDGCVVAADVGGGIKGKQLDLFVARRAYYEGLARRGSSHGWATSVEVWDGQKRCTRRGSKVSRSAAASI